MRIVLDTNVLVSALITRGTPPDLLYEAWLKSEFELVTSRAQLAELERVCSYPRLRAFLGPVEAEVLLQTIDAVATVIEDLPEVELSRDRDDDAILATALAGEVDLLVTGDKSDLLVLESVAGIEIVTPREALSRLGH